MKYAIPSVTLLVVSGVTWTLVNTFEWTIALPLALLCSVVFGTIAGIYQAETEN